MAQPRVSMVLYDPVLEESNETKYREIFDLLDTSKKGKVTVEELRSSDAVPKEIIKEVEKTLEQSLAFEDFCILLEGLRR